MSGVRFPKLYQPCHTLERIQPLCCEIPPHSSLTEAKAKGENVFPSQILRNAMNNEPWVAWQCGRRLYLVLETPELLVSGWALSDKFRFPERFPQTPRRIFQSPESFYISRYRLLGIDIKTTALVFSDWWSHKEESKTNLINPIKFSNKNISLMHFLVILTIQWHVSMHAKIITIRIDMRRG